MWSRSVIPALGFVVGCAVPWKYVGWIGVAGYGAALAILVLAIGRGLFDRAGRHRPVCVALAGGLVTLAAAMLYPLSKSHRFGRGSDRDEALNLGIHDLLTTFQPYAHRTSLGDRISPLPGELILHLPAYLATGTAAVAAPIWLIIMVWLSSRWITEPRPWLLFVAALLVLNPGVMRDVATGGDYVSNAIEVAIGLHLVTRALSWRRAGRIAAYAGLGLVLSTRLVYPVLLLPAAGLVWRQLGRREAAGMVLVTGAAMALLCLPWYLDDPSGFAPLHMMRAYARIPTLHDVPIVVASLTVLAALIGAVAVHRSGDLGLTGGLILAVALSPAFLAPIFQIGHGVAELEYLIPAALLIGLAAARKPQTRGQPPLSCNEA